MDQLFRLILDGAYNLRMTVTRRADCDSGVAVEEDVSVNVFDPNSLTALSDQFK
jgi:hypothetical protein